MCVSQHQFRSGEGRAERLLSDAYAPRRAGVLRLLGGGDKYRSAMRMDTKGSPHAWAARFEGPHHGTATGLTPRARACSHCQRTGRPR